MFTFDNKKMTFINLTTEEKKELINVARKILYEGKIDWGNKFVKNWIEHFKFDENQRLLVITVTFVPRALDSCIE